MRLRKPTESTKLSAEEQRLSKEQQVTLRRMEELEKELQNFPKRIEEKKAREREAVKMRAALAPAAMPMGGVRASRSAYQATRKPKKLPSREFHSARIKFLALCLILATIIFMLWRSIPS
ncbi:MAG: hypothetical protein WCG66_09085 [bacterium]